MHPNIPTTRRTFLGGAAALGITALTGSARAAQPEVSPRQKDDSAPGRRVVVGVMGTSRDTKGGDGRGSHLAATLATLAGVHVAYVCDVDARNVPKAIESVSKHLR